MPALSDARKDVLLMPSDVKICVIGSNAERRPNGPARILFAMIGRDPWLVFDVFNINIERHWRNFY